MGSSARNAREWDRLMNALGVFTLVETSRLHILRARQVQRLLASRSQKIPDLLVAAAAEDAGLVVLHDDSDFDHIARVTGQSCEWVAPSGLID